VTGEVITIQSTPRRSYESIAAAADRMGVSTRTLRRRIADGSLRAYRLGPRIIRLDAAEVDRLMVPVPTA
jgi:excisionase family DNA binding protein